MVQPLILHAHVGPNPWKVALILEELDIPYNVKVWATADLKHLPFTDLNPNGHTPVIEDPNTNTVLWESGAIIEYLLETYDKTFLISFQTARERNLVRQWLYFQVAFQGPPLSQVFVFSNFEANPKARAYFVKESLRVMQVLDQTLQHRDWLVGEQRSAADLVFIPYYAGLAVCNIPLPALVTTKADIDSWVKVILSGDTPDIDRSFPNVSGWLARLCEFPVAKKIIADRAAALATLTGGGN